MKAKTVFFCTDCGNETLKWQGRCPACGSWNTIVEQPAEQLSRKTARNTRVIARKSATPLNQLDTREETRFITGISEMDRVLGGGVVRGSLVLVGGAPGIGKSTLLLQICSQLCHQASVLYVTGEESEHQLKLRADRLGVDCSSLYILAETNLSAVSASVAEIHPDVLIIDSIQTLSHEDVTSAPGSVTQVKECTLTLMQMAKGEGITIFLVGHVNKEGAIAGPKVLEHMVDCVLSFEGNQSQSYRILRATKNRYGSTNEIGVFDMLDSGLAEIRNPSEMLLSGRPENTPGTCVACVMEGSRPILAEIQALITPTSFNIPRRNANGIEYNRAMLLLAVMEKRGGLRVGSCDAYINVIGGLSLNEPGADLPAALSIASSYRDKPIEHNIAAFGEIGLSGELRPVSHVTQRLSEIKRLGFQKCIIPYQNKLNYKVPDGLSVLKVKNLREALNSILH